MAVGAGFEEAQALSFTDLVGLAGEGGEEAGEVNAVFAGEVGGDHGTVEAGQVEGVEECDLEGGEVAVAEERLGVIAENVHIEGVEEVVAAVSATGCEEDADGVVGECGVEIEETLFDSAGEVEWAAGEHVGRFDGEEAEVAEALHAALDLGGVGG